MLKIVIPGVELYDPVKEIFCTKPGTELTMEHSLISLSKWEMKWKKPFLTQGLTASSQLTPEEMLDYFKCMTLTQNVDPDVYKYLSQDNITKIGDYINDPMTATTVSNRNEKAKQKQRVITSELIYAWMAILRIPYECQKWHLNRLLMLIQVTSLEQEPAENRKMDKTTALKKQRALNAARRRKFKSRG